jgi:two-component system sensor histidine kinase KdpD
MSEDAISERVKAARRDDGEGWGTPFGHAATLALIALVTLAGQALFARGDLADIGLLYLVPVMYAGTRHGLLTGLAAGVVSTLAYNFFFIPPVHTLAIAEPSHLVTLLVLLGVAVVGSQLAARVRGQAALAQADASREAALAGFARVLMAANGRPALWSVLAGEIARLFDVRTVVLSTAEDGLRIRAAEPAQDRLDLIDQAAAQWCLDHAQAAGPGAATLTTSEWLFHPIRSGETAQAVLGVARGDAGEPLPHAAMPLLASLLDQAGLALARITLEEEMVALGRLQERETLRAALLSSVGHDLRTPLTTVLGLLRAIRPESAAQAEQLSVARSEAERLDRFVGNLLDMVRIESGAIERAPEPVDLAEAVAAALDDMRRTLGGHALHVAVADDLPLVLADARLLHHCLINLIDNACKHGGAGGAITIAVAEEPAGLTLSVMDEGPGIPPGEEARVFGMFARAEGSDRVGGSGLGLAIVQGFADAMGFAVDAGGRAGQPGARFSIHMPASALRMVEKPA